MNHPINRDTSNLLTKLIILNFKTQTQGSFSSSKKSCKKSLLSVTLVKNNWQNYTKHISTSSAYQEDCACTTAYLLFSTQLAPVNAGAESVPSLLPPQCWDNKQRAAAASCPQGPNSDHWTTPAHGAACGLAETRWVPNTGREVSLNYNANVKSVKNGII